MTDKQLLALMEDEGIDEDKLEPCRAYLEAMNIDSLEDFEEAYIGQYTSDKDFAEDQAWALGYINGNSNWPFNCIDWEHAGQELMHDYTENDGYYFRDL